METFAPKERKKYERNPHPKDSPEYHAEKLRRARECKERNAEKYRPMYDAEKTGGAPPLPKDGDLTWGVPADLQDYIGQQTITLEKEAYNWPLYRLKRHAQLASLTLKSYKSYWVRLPKKGIWDICRELRIMENTLQNMYYKAALSFTCENLFNAIYTKKLKSLPASADYKRQLLEMAVYAIMNRKTMRASYANHTAQVASEQRHENTVDWELWTAGARRYVKALLTKPGGPSRVECQEAIAVAVYSMIPPIRLDWNDVEVRLCCGGEKARLNIKGEEGKNIVYVSTSWAVAFWGEFKNSASFVGELPLRQELPKDLFHVFRKTYPAEKIDAKDYCWFPLKIPNFGTYLARLAKLITGKNFTNRLMRSSYITWYHKNNNQDAFDLEKTRAVMRLLHQTNLEVHLAYNKFKSIDDLPEEIMNHITNVGNAESDSD